MNEYIVPFESVGKDDIETVGGKNASLGEMISALSEEGIDVPAGFAITALAYRDFLANDGLGDRIYGALERLDVDDIGALRSAGADIRRWIEAAPFPDTLRVEIEAAYATLGDGKEVAVAVRSSATAEDLPEASFAGQQDTLLNIRGLDAVVEGVHAVYASLFTDRAISYRTHHGFDHRQVALSVGVQEMVRADLSSSGVMFTLDTDSGFRDVVFITAGYGLGETLVQGSVNPDEFYVYKPALAAGRSAILRRTLGTKALKMVYAENGAATPVTTVEVPAEDRRRFSISDAEVEELARQAMRIERHYGCPMDIEWAKDGVDGRLRIVQARPETVQGRSGRLIERFTLEQSGRVIAKGRSIGHKIGSGPARVVESVAEIGVVRRRRR